MVRIIDYKSGKTTFQLLNLYYGQQLQLVVYLNAAMAQLKKVIRKRNRSGRNFLLSDG